MGDIHINGTLLRKVRMADLKVDHTYQRGLDDKHVKKIAENIRPEMLGVIVVSERDDGLYILDGQHRHGGYLAAGKGDTMIAVDVRRGLTLQQEAELFYQLNGPMGQKAVRAYFKFRARVVAEEPIAVEIDQIVRSIGLRMAEGKAKLTIAAPQAAERIHTRCHNLKATLRVLTALSRACGLDAAAYDKEMIEAVGWFLYDFPSADHEVLVKKLQAVAGKHGIQAIVDALAHERRTWKSEPARSCVVNTMVKFYNTRNAKPLLRENRVELAA